MPVVCELREAEADLAAGTAPDHVHRKLGVSEATNHRLRKRYGEAGADGVRLVKELEQENARLKAILAELESDKRIL